MNESQLYPLLDYLADASIYADVWWEGWRIQRINGGANNLLYRATGARDLAIKWTLRDNRDRAGREYAALSALQQAGTTLAPVPILLDRERYPLPVVVQTWLAGEVSVAPPQTDAEWLALVQHFAAIHALTPDRTTVPLAPAVLSMESARSGLARIYEQRALLPLSVRPPALEVLIQQIESIAFPLWSPTALALCHSDPNTLNLIRRPVAWASVDWENSGWGDPAFEIADMMAHPTYLDVTPERWQSVVATYCLLRGDAALAGRIAVYHTLSLVWWVARFARALYEVPRGLDQRLVAPAPGWQAETEIKYVRYLERARAAVMHYEE